MINFDFIPYLAIFLCLFILFVFFRHWLRVLFLLPSVLLDRLRHKAPRRIYGVRAYVGAVGQGKTISMVKEVFEIKKNFPNVKIYSNMSVDWAEYIVDLKDLYSIFDSDIPSLVVWDEVGVNLNSRSWSLTPIELISRLAQNRKGSGTRLIYTAQSYDMVDKQIRTLTNDVIFCKTILDRITMNYTGHSVRAADGTLKIGLPCKVFDNKKFRERYDTLETVKKIILFNDNSSNRSSSF